MATAMVSIYREVLDDPKVQRLCGDLFKIWVNLLCVGAGNDGILPPAADIAFAVRLSEKDSSKAIAELIARGLIDRDGETLTIHNWADRQRRSDTSKDRMQRHRERSKAVSGDVSRPSHVTDLDRHLEQDGDVTDDASVTSPVTGPLRHPRRNGLALESESKLELESDTESSSSSGAPVSGKGLSDVELAAKLREAAGGHVDARCANVAPIRKLIAGGCDLERDILPFVRERIPKLTQPLQTWGATWLRVEVEAASKARRARPQGGAVVDLGALVFVGADSPNWNVAASRYRTAHRKSPPVQDFRGGRRGWYFASDLLSDAQPIAIAEQGRPA